MLTDIYFSFAGKCIYLLQAIPRCASLRYTFCFFLFILVYSFGQDFWAKAGKIRIYFTIKLIAYLCYFLIVTKLMVISGKGRLYPAYSLSGSEGEESVGRRYGDSHTYQHPLYQQPSGLSDTPTSENASDATLTDSELALARDSTLLVHNGKFNYQLNCKRQIFTLKINNKCKNRKLWSSLILIVHFITRFQSFPLAE